MKIDARNERGGDNGGTERGKEDQIHECGAEKWGECSLFVADV